MPVRWDPLLARALARELSAALYGSRTRALLFDPEARRVLLFLRNATLAFELHPLAGWVSSLAPSDPLAGSRPLRGRLAGVRALHDESALAFDIRASRGRGEGAVKLVVELVGNRWNAALVDPSGKSQQVLRPQRGGKRPLEAGRAYEPPPSTGRVEPRDASEWGEIAGTLGGDRRKRLLSRVAWTSSLNVEWLAGADGWERWMRMIQPDGWRAYLLSTGRGSQPYPLPLGDSEAEPLPSLLEAFAAARERSESADSTDALLVASELLAAGERRVRRLTSRAANLRRELAATVDPGELRRRGDLILARFTELPRGTVRAVVPGFDGAPVELALDPTLAADQNAARHYAKAARMERARARLPARIETAEREAERWRRLVEGVRAGRVPPDELAREVRPPGAARTRQKTGSRPAAPPYRRLTSSGGLEIRIGRSARQNDELTFRHSAPDDIWLHARQAAGAHVILRWGREGNPPRRDLVEAATLAALHSEARHSGSVAITWTRRKHVRKPRKSPAGSVVAERAQTLIVEPDPGLLERLAVEAEGG